MTDTTNTPLDPLCWPCGERHELPDADEPRDAYCDPARFTEPGLGAPVIEDTPALAAPWWAAP